MSQDPEEIRARIEECRQDLARAQGEQETLQQEVNSSLEELRELLGCKPGKERDALKKLQDKVKKAEGKIEKLLAEIEEGA